MFGRRRSRTAPPDPIDGQERCSQARCGRRDGARCAYVDKRSRTCPTAWCPEHGGTVAGTPYCRRHASTMAAIGGEEVVAGMPDLDNRAPSLIGCIGRDLDPHVRELLTRIAPPGGGVVVADPVCLVLNPGGASRRWAKTWKLLDHTSVLNRVSVEVDELDDRLVLARVDSELIGKGIPPWIENREAGRRVDPNADLAQRGEFASAMARSVELVITRQGVLPRY